MRQIDEKRLAKLHTAGELLNEKYGTPGRKEREDFNDQSVSWYYGEILRERRKQMKITQQELADRVGIARSYIARGEKGETNIQFSSFFRIAKALRIEFTCNSQDLL